MSEILEMTGPSTVQAGIRPIEWFIYFENLIWHFISKLNKLSKIHYEIVQQKSFEPKYLFFYWNLKLIILVLMAERSN